MQTTSRLYTTSNWPLEQIEKAHCITRLLPQSPPQCERLVALSGVSSRIQSRSLRLSVQPGFDQAGCRIYRKTFQNQVSFNYFWYRHQTFRVAFNLATEFQMFWRFFVYPAWQISDNIFSPKSEARVGWCLKNPGDLDIAFAKCCPCLLLILSPSDRLLFNSSLPSLPNKGQNIR